MKHMDFLMSDDGTFGSQDLNPGFIFKSSHMDVHIDKHLNRES